MKSNSTVLVLCLLVSLVSFFPTIRSGFVFDFIGWQDDYDHGKFSDIINCFGYNGNHQVLHLVFYSFYKIFGIQGLPWYLFFSVLHAINGFLLYKVMMVWFEKLKIRINITLIYLGVGIFLLHPYNVEPVVWKVCVHYLLSLMAMLALVYFLPHYLQKGERKYLIIAGLIFFTSLFLLEISFATPILITLLAAITWMISEKRKSDIPLLAKYTGMTWALLLVHLLINKLTLGTLVGHYGADVHLQFNLINTVAAEFKYFFKHIFFARYFSFKTKNLIFDQILSSSTLAFFLLTAFIMVSLWYVIRIRKVRPAWHLVYFGIVASMILILPVVNLHFNHLQIGMNDRYSYFPLAFLSMSLVALCSMIRHKAILILPVVFLGVSIYLQQKTIVYWKQSADVLYSLKNDFRWHDAPYVFVLNSPDNFNGIVMTCMINGDTGIDEVIDYQTDRPYNGKMYDIYQFNMTSPADGVKVEQIGPMQLKVTFNQWGNWWHRNGIGASNYENEYYKVEMLDYPYILTFKQFPEGSVVIYQDGKEWKEFDIQL